MRGLALLLLLSAPGPAGAEAWAAGAAPALVATRTIRAQSVLLPGDVGPGRTAVPGALTDPAQAVGLEARTALYAGRPIRPGDLGPPALVARNGTVALVYRSGGLVITAEGRALARAGEGEEVRAINLGSNVIVTGRVAADGRVHVGPGG